MTVLAPKTAGTEPTSNGIRTAVPIMLLTTACASVLVVILLAGLWPFHAARNDVSWASEGNGILFGKRGSIASADSFGARPSRAGSSCSLEIWLEPNRVDSGGTVLAFYLPAIRVTPFRLRQFVSGLELQRRSVDQSASNARIFVEGVFSHRQPIFLTVSSGEEGTAIYVDGALVKKSPSFRILPEDLTGQLIMGNAPSTSNNWSGHLMRLAIFDRELTASEVSQHFEARTNIEYLRLTKSEGAVASYLFNEGGGNIIHNQVGSAPNLLVPGRYFVIHQQFLELPWSEFHSRWSYWLDVVVNIVGFVPLGFFFRAYLSAVCRIKRATWATIGFGFAVSLTIEVLQGFLPTRDSSMTDLLTNTLGTALGALVCTWSMKQDWLPLVGIPSILLPGSCK